MELPDGLYEALIDHGLSSALAAIDPHVRRLERAPLDVGESHYVLARHLTPLIARALERLHGDGPQRLAKQMEICNNIVRLLGACDDCIDTTTATIDYSGQQLLSILAASQPLATRPDTPLSTGCILTGPPHDPSFVSQLQAEMSTADRVDILCSFIKWSGIRILEQALCAFADRPGTKLRIITTSYMGATDIKAIDFLCELRGSQLRVSYDTRRTRLHAKAYVFHRESGYGTAYIGSANISNPALTDGLEWVVKVSQREAPHLWQKIGATFEGYINDKRFQDYHGLDEDRDQLRKSLAGERTSQGGTSAVPQFFDVRPYPYQQEILDALQAEREVHGQHRNLVVAATGTGKTVVAAFDYQRLRQHLPGPCRLLFVAHRKEILEQAHATFRGVLRDANFGDLLVGEHEPQGHDHLFVSIQSFCSRRLAETLPADHFDVIVIDEFHHAAASSYAELLATFRPKVLLGLTATPERSDQLDILSHFDGRIAAEIRLPDAVNRKLLCPFQYFGITDDDSVDLRKLTWTRGGFTTAELDGILTGNHARARLVIGSITKTVTDVRQACALCFCVSQAHAAFMAEQFQKAGIPAAFLTSESDPETRREVRQQLVTRQINFLCVVDLYNEGVDVPELDTVVFLRPTESLTVFLQQLGRGLRLHDGKECLCVLDFVSRAHAQFNWEQRFRALLGHSTARIEDEITGGFPYLPAGCSITLERYARKYILENIQHNILHATRDRLVGRIRTFAVDTGKPLELGTFTDHYQLPLDRIYRKKSWSRLCALAGVTPPWESDDEAKLTLGLRRLAAWNSAPNIRRLREILTRCTTPDDIGHLTEKDKRLLVMATFSLFGSHCGHRTGAETVMQLHHNPRLFDELVLLLELLHDRVRTTVYPYTSGGPCPLYIHGKYTRDEILAGLGHWTLEKQPAMREGVKYLPEQTTDVLLVTLNKTEKDYSPTTMYEDYAINDELFHWQSQSTTSVGSRTGQRYLNQRRNTTTILLFVREHKKQDGVTCPYDFLGPVDYVSHQGTQPISITWRLRTPIPARLLRKSARIATG